MMKRIEIPEEVILAKKNNTKQNQTPKKLLVKGTLKDISYHSMCKG